MPRSSPPSAGPRGVASGVTGRGASFIGEACPVQDPAQVSACRRSHGKERTIDLRFHSLLKRGEVEDARIAANKSLKVSCNAMTYGTSTSACPQMKAQKAQMH